MNDSDIRARKAVLRKSMITLRSQLSEEEAKRRSTLIADGLRSLQDYQKAKTILFYVSVKNEVDTHELIREALQTGKRIAVPITNLREKVLCLSEIKGMEELKKSTFDLLEPAEEFRRPTSLQEIDLVVVPGIAFDRKGNRIGYGAGFYDRLLSTRPDVLKVALAYQFQVVDRIDIYDGDVPIDILVTEEGVSIF